MGGLLSISPWVWVGALLLLAGAFGSGFTTGVEWQQGKDAVHDKEVLVKKVETIRTVVKQDNVLVAKHEQEKEALRVEMDGLRREYEKVRGVLDKRDGVCDLPADVLGVLNRARGGSGSSADSGKPAATVRPLAAPAGWAAGGGDKAND